MNKDYNQKYFLFKSLAIIIQPLSLILSHPGIQLIAQGTIYAISDTIIGNREKYPKIEDTLVNYDTMVKSATKEILKEYDVNQSSITFKKKYRSLEDITRLIVDQWCERHSNQFSEIEKSHINSALVAYFIKVYNWNLQNPEYVRMIINKFGEKINEIESRVTATENRFEGFQKGYIGNNQELEDYDSKLRTYLADVLIQKRDNHPSFKLLKADEIDSCLYPKIIVEYSQIEPMGNTLENSGRNSEGSSPVWEIIQKRWSEHRNVVIIGGGGIGKTVTLFSITLAPNHFLPVPALYIPMYDLVSKDGILLDLDEYIEKKYKPYYKQIDVLSTKEWDEHPQILVLLDGFNEVPFSLRRYALHVINEWYISHPGTQIIAVSRPIDGINLITELSGNPIPIKLAFLDKKTVQDYLAKAEVRMPSETNPIWKDLRYPLFLNLYIKTSRLKGQSAAGYPLLVKKSVSGGALIWNYLQRELLRYNSDDPNKEEDWVLRCSVANEYILPYLAYRMVSAQRFEIRYDEAKNYTIEILGKLDDNILPRHLKDIWRCFEEQHGYLPLKGMFTNKKWIDTVLQDTGMLIPFAQQNRDEKNEYVDRSFVLVHQHFRDCLAGLYLVNQAETAKDNELPEVWQHGQNHLALNYTAELLDSKIADRLWKSNQMKQQYISSGYMRNDTATCALLEFQKRRNPLPNKLDFSGMDLRNLSLVRYLGLEKNILPLFQFPSLTYCTKLNRATFQSEGHCRVVTHIVALPDGRVVSGSFDNDLRVWDPSTGLCLKTMHNHANLVNLAVSLSDGRMISRIEDNNLCIWDVSTGKHLKTLNGHTRKITCVKVLPTGYVVSGSDDGDLRIWDTNTGLCQKILHGYNSRKVTCVAVLPDGYVISGSNDGDLRIWDTNTGLCQKILRGYIWQAVTCVAVLPDGYVISGSDDGDLRIWDTNTGLCQKILHGNNRRIEDVALLPDGRVVSETSDGKIWVWDLSTGQCLYTFITNYLKNYREEKLRITVLPDGRVIGRDRSKLLIWDSYNGKLLQVLNGHKGDVTDMVVLPDGCVVSGSEDCSLRVWDPSAGRCLQVLEGHREYIKSQAYHSEVWGKKIEEIDHDHKVWDDSNIQIINTLVGHTDFVRCAVTTEDGRVVSGSEDSTLRVWDPSTRQCLRILRGHQGGITCEAILPSGNIISGSSDYSLRIWNPFTGECLQILNGHTGQISCICVLPDGRIVSGSEDNTLRLWDTSTGQNIRVLQGHKWRVTCVANLLNGNIVSGSEDNTLRVWNPSTGECLQILDGHTHRISCILVLSDGHVISGSEDNDLRVWNPLTGQCLKILKGHTGTVTCASVLPNDHIVSGSEDNTLRVWDPSTGQCIHILRGHNWAAVTCVAVLPNGCVVSGSVDHTVRVWSTTSGNCLYKWEGHTSWIECLTVLPNGLVVSGSFDRTLRVWKSDDDRYINIIEATEVSVEKMDFSNAILTEDVARLLWNNGAKISEADYEKYIVPDFRK